jgi:hypothetical protein
LQNGWWFERELKQYFDVGGEQAGAWVRQVALADGAERL